MLLTEGWGDEKKGNGLGVGQVNGESAEGSTRGREGGNHQRGAIGHRQACHLNASCTLCGGGRCEVDIPLCVTNIYRMSLSIETQMFSRSSLTFAAHPLPS
jgi:hypothetical protein